MRAPALQLSSRQFEVVRLRALGLSNGEVSLRLGLAEHTVKNHVVAAFRKARVETFVELLGALGWLVIPESDVSPAEIRHERLLWHHG